MNGIAFLLCPDLKKEIDLPTLSIFKPKGQTNLFLGLMNSKPHNFCQSLQSWTKTAGPLTGHIPLVCYKFGMYVSNFLCSLTPPPFLPTFSCWEQTDYYILHNILLSLHHVCSVANTKIYPPKWNTLKSLLQVKKNKNKHKNKIKKKHVARIA